MGENVMFAGRDIDRPENVVSAGEDTDAVDKLSVQEESPAGKAGEEPGTQEDLCPSGKRESCEEVSAGEKEGLKTGSEVNAHADVNPAGKHESGEATGRKEDQAEGSEAGSEADSRMSCSCESCEENAGGDRSRTEHPDAEGKTEADQSDEMDQVQHSFGQVVQPGYYQGMQYSYGRPVQPGYGLAGGYMNVPPVPPVPPQTPPVSPGYGYPGGAGRDHSSGYVSAVPPVPPQIPPVMQTPPVQPGYDRPVDYRNAAPLVQPQISSPGYGQPAGYTNVSQIPPVPPQIPPVPQQSGYGNQGYMQMPPQQHYQTADWQMIPPRMSPVPPSYDSGYQGQGADGLAIASMILGMVSIVLCAWFYLALPCAIIGLVLGCVYRGKGGKNGMSIAGISCSGAGILIGLIVLLAFLMAV